MAITLQIISPSDIERGMVISGQVVVGTTFLEAHDIIEVELGCTGPRVVFPLTARLIAIEGDGPRVKVVREWPSDADYSAERSFDLRMKRRADGVKPRRAGTKITHDKFDWSDEELMRHLESGR